MKKSGRITLTVTLSLIISMLAMNILFSLNRTEGAVQVPENVEPMHLEYLRREEINGLIKERLYEGRSDEVMYLYADITGDPDLAASITRYALRYDIPVSLLFSIVYVESSFNPDALNRNRNGTLDYGLMSLNSKTFADYSREELYDLDMNLKLGCEFLVDLKKRYSSWGEAVIHYNGLYTKGAGSYMVKVMEMEREFEDYFNKSI